MLLKNELDQSNNKVAVRYFEIESSSTETIWSKVLIIYV